MVFLARITVAQAATAINAAITFIQYSLELALVALLVHTIPPVNTAISWTSITSALHSSLWPTLLRTDSTVSRSTGWRVYGFSKLSFFIAILIAATGVITPLGLEGGPLLASPARFTDASYTPDTSPIGLATAPRGNYSYTRICGVFGPFPCPGNGDNRNTSQIAPSMVEIFSSTPHGPFGMQFRQYYSSLDALNYTTLTTEIAILQSLILRDDIFAVEGLIVDLTDTPGIGFWNHTMPTLSHGGEWSQDVLWLEPVTSCVSSNLTIDYTMEKGSVAEPFNLTDWGGFSNLTRDYPNISMDGQSGSIYDHAFKGAAWSNRLAMMALNNLTREQSYIGKSFPLNHTLITGNLKPGAMGPIDLLYLSNAYNIIPDFSPGISCVGYGGGDKANVATAGIHCGMFAGTPERSDGGDSRSTDDGSTWTQSLYGCASVTRARIQTVTFSIDGPPDLSKLRISRRNTGEPVLWATEKTSLNIIDVDLLWGHVDDSYENDPSLSTIRSEVFYVPAGASDIWGTVSPITVPAASWSESYGPSLLDDSYTGKGNYALLQKFETIIKNDSINGPARIRNLIWTDILANNIVGNATSTQLSVAAFQPSVAYELVYAIPAILLFVVWVFAFLAAVLLLISGSLRISHIRDLINHTSIGRVVVGDSCLVVTHGPPTPEKDPGRRPPSPTSGDSLMHDDGATHSPLINPDTPLPISEDSLMHDGGATHSPSVNLDSQSWARTMGLSVVKFSAARPADY